MLVSPQEVIRKEDKTTTVDLSIIIVNYNTVDYLRQCLQSIYLHPCQYTFEVIVVDNASADGSVEMVRQEFPSVRVIANRYNYGFAIASNQGYRVCRGKYVMSLNPDTEVLGGTLDELIRFMDCEETAGLVAPAVVKSDGSAYLPCDERIRFHYPLILLILQRLLRARRKKKVQEQGSERCPLQVSWTWGTGLVCRRLALPKGYYFEEITFLFGEEYYLCRYLKKGGYRLFVLPYAYINHVLSVTYRFDIHSLYFARKLGTVVSWRIFKQEYGLFTANLNQLILLVDASLLWSKSAIVKKILGSSMNRAIIQADYAALVIASIGVLIRGEKYVEKVNLIARRYFNGGVDPPLPPVVIHHYDFNTQLSKNS